MILKISQFGIIIDQAILKNFQLGRGEKKNLYGNELVYVVGQNNPTPPECVVNGTECYDG